MSIGLDDYKGAERVEGSLDIRKPLSSTNDFLRSPTTF
jgi:hypothetical protein